jgi:hypothetical protein
MQSRYGFEAHEAHESGFREDKYKEWGYEDEYEDRLMKKIWIGTHACYNAQK